jgi:hypothetical protein
VHGVRLRPRHPVPIPTDQQHRCRQPSTENAIAAAPPIRNDVLLSPEAIDATEPAT